MKHRAFCILLAFFMIAMPIQTYAEELETLSADETQNQTFDEFEDESIPFEETVNVEERDHAEEIQCQITIGSTVVTTDNAGDILGDGTAFYDVENNILTLNNVNIDTAINYGLNIDGDLNIHLIGENTIVNEGVCGIRATGSLTFNGSGSLTVFGQDYGIYARQDIHIGDSVILNVSCGDITDGDNFALYAGYSYTSQIVISGNATINASAGYAPNYSYGVYSDDNLTICENAVVNTTGGKGFDRSCGMYAISNIWIKDEARVETAGKDTQEMENNFNDSYGIRTTQLYVSGGSLTATGGSANAYSAGIFTQVMEVSGGNVLSKAAYVTKGPSVGLQVTKEFLVSGGNVQAIGGDTAGNTSSGIDAGNTVIHGGNITASSGIGDNVWGFKANDLTITDGEVCVTTEKTTGFGRGIQAHNALTISGGEIDVYVKEAGQGSYILQTASRLLICGGEIVLVSETAPVSYGIWAFESTNIVGCHLNIQTEGNGIYVPFDRVDIGYPMQVTKNNEDQEADTYLKIEAEGDYGIYAKNDLILSENTKFENPVDAKAVQLGEGENTYWTIVDGPENSVVKSMVLSTSKDDMNEEENETDSPESNPESDAPETNEPESEPETDAPETNEPESDPETDAPETNKPESESETDVPETKPTETPGTGDTMPVILLVSVMVASFMLMEGIVIFWMTQKRKK